MFQLYVLQVLASTQPFSPYGTPHTCRYSSHFQLLELQVLAGTQPFASFGTPGTE